MMCCLLESRAAVNDVYGSRSLDSTQSENGTFFIREVRQWRKPRTKVDLLFIKQTQKQFLVLMRKNWKQ